LGPIPNPQSPIPNPQSPLYFLLILNNIILYYSLYYLLRLNEKKY
jgi:hypothetical protein